MKFSLDRLISYVAKIVSLTLWLESAVKREHKGSNSYPSSARVCYGDNGEQIPVDSDRNQRQEVAGGEETIQTPEEAEQDTRGLRDFEEISKISPVDIYIPTLLV